MNFDKRIRGVLLGLLVMTTIYCYMVWEIITLAMKIALGLAYVLVTLNKLIPSKTKGVISGKAKMMYYINSLITIAILALVTAELVRFWNQIDFLGRAGIIIVDLVVGMDIIFEFFPTRKKKEETL